MLTLTDSATTVVKQIATQNTDAAGTGLRISSTEAGGTELNLSVAPEPQPQDQVVEADGARVFLEPTASMLLDDKVLDAHIEENGSVSFAIGQQTA